MVIPGQKQSTIKAKKSEDIPENKFVDRLVKALNAKEVELDDGTIWMLLSRTLLTKLLMVIGNR